MVTRADSYGSYEKYLDSPFIPFPMKTKILIPFFCLIVLASNAQQKQRPITKQETLEWLNQKISQYALHDKDILYNYNLQLENDLLIIDYNYTMKGSWYTHGIAKIPITMIVSCYFQEYPAAYWFTINIKGGANKIMIEFDNQTTKYLPSYSFILSKSVENDNLKERILKAFNHLTELYNVKMGKEVF